MCVGMRQHPLFVVFFGLLGFALDVDRARVGMALVESGPSCTLSGGFLHAVAAVTRSEQILYDFSMHWLL